ncbi:hypothetical protein J437_LFUL018362 [Ladona fulva]|uniref:PiggyBac transposable element-derived protein domain-containing protein n=1 Tax=Ladona fulva TaxID=123851 RepID=A0A8K0KSL3_LADFU|nr:hypothetical protein J437_LFUL018362 [Ladona fulva]
MAAGYSKSVLCDEDIAFILEHEDILSDDAGSDKSSEIEIDYAAIDLAQPSESDGESEGDPSGKADVFEDSWTWSGIDGSNIPKKINFIGKCGPTVPIASSIYLPKENIAVDESLMLWKGRLSFRQYIPLKSSKFGIKTFELCESETGYLWSFIVYSGADSKISVTTTPDGLKTSALVIKLLEPLFAKGYTLWMDNYYNSPNLAKFLLIRGTNVAGTLRLNRKNVPPEVKSAKLKKGEHVAKFQQKDGKFKPVCILEYNKAMGGVDLKDQKLQPYLLERKPGAEAESEAPEESTKVMGEEVGEGGSQI